MGNQKRLLLLGGSQYLFPVIRAARELGIYTITCDYLPDNIAHKYSDEYCNVSIIDKEAVLEAAKKLNIDGVMSFACDPGVATAAYVAEKLGLPSAGSYEAIRILQNKKRFRKFLTDNGFNVPTAKGYTDIEEALADTALFHWPVIVKPTDSAGSKGVTRVDDPAKLRESIEYALSFSHCSEFIIEDFLEKVNHSSDTDCFSVNGQLKFVSYSAQRFDEDCENPYAPCAYSWPGTISREHQEELTREIQRVITLLGLKTSIFNIETRECTDGKAYIMELTPRGGGNCLAEVLRYATGVDMITNAVRAAVGMDVVDMEQKPYNGVWSEIILHSDTPGVFDRLEIAESIRDNIVEQNLWIRKGDKVGGFSGANEAIGMLVLKFDTEEEMLSVLENPKKYIQVKLEERKQKRLLLLGGTQYQLPVIRAAKELGIYTITCDYLPDNIAHKYSDEYCNVSIIDKEAVLEAARKLNIDGIMSFACDPGVVTAAYVAEKLGLPSCGSYESVSILQNKGKFRKFLTENGFNVPTAKGYTDIEEALADTALFHWPVIVKPADSAGSKGVKRVDDVKDLRKSIEYALSFSHSNEFIIEDFLTKVGHSSDTDCFSVDGQLKFVSFSAQRFDENCDNPYTPAAFSWPSTLTEEHERELTGEIQRLLTLLNMKTSIYNIETRECTDGKAYIMELSPRGGGNRLAEVLRYATGVDLIGNAVRAAVGMELSGVEQKPYNGCWAEVILHSVESGVFDSLWISEKIQNHVVERDLWVQSGDKVGGFSGANEAIGTLILKFENEEKMLTVLENQADYIRVLLK